MEQQQTKPRGTNSEEEENRTRAGRSVLWFPERTSDFSSLQKGKTGSGISQNIIQWVPAQIRPQLKRSGREADHSPRSRTNMPLWRVRIGMERFAVKRRSGDKIASALNLWVLRFVAIMLWGETCSILCTGNWNSGERRLRWGKGSRPTVKTGIWLQGRT